MYIFGQHSLKSQSSTYNVIYHQQRLLFLRINIPIMIRHNKHIYDQTKYEFIKYEMLHTTVLMLWNTNTNICFIFLRFDIPIKNM